MLPKLLLIALGGALGAVSRYSLSGAIQRLFRNGSFPWGTLAVNVLGSLLVGFLIAYFTSPAGARVREEHRLAILVGFLGGFTTFSTFAYETFARAADGNRSAALANLLLTNVLCLAAVALAYRAAERLWPA